MTVRTAGRHHRRRGPGGWLLRAPPGRRDGRCHFELSAIVAVAVAVAAVGELDMLNDVSHQFLIHVDLPVVAQCAIDWEVFSATCHLPPATKRVRTHRVTGPGAPPVGAWGPEMGEGGVQRGYLLNLRVKVPPAQIPVWRRSHIRQSTGETLTAESPDVNVLKRGRETPDQPRRLAIRRAVARANGLIVEIPPQRGVGRWVLGVPSVSFPYAMASAGAEGTGKCTHQAPGGS